MMLKNSYEQYLRKEYSIPNNRNIVIKRGFVISKSEELIKQDDPFKIRDLVYQDIKNETMKIRSLLENANEEIGDLLRLKEIAQDADEQVYNLQIELVVDDLFNDLSNVMRDLSNNAYQSFILRLNEDSDGKTEYLYNHALLDEEIYGKINQWVKNLKNWFLDKLDQTDAESDLQTKSNFANQAYILNCYLDNAFENMAKDFWSDALDSIEKFFSNLKSRIENLIFNAVSLVQTEAKKVDLKVHGIDHYQIVLSDNDNVCDKCRKMDGEIFNVNELKVGVTAPPFHPNCGCTIIMKRTIADIDEPLDLVDPSGEYDREEATQYAMQWFDGQNPEYPSFGDSGDCANFVSQCLVAGGFKMNEYWHCYDRNEINPINLLKPNSKWSYTEAWSVAKDQYEYLKNSDMIIEEVILNRADEISAAVNDSENPVKVGDVMYLQWDHDYPHHATIISKVEDGMIYYAAHTESRDYMSLSDFFEDYSNGQAYILKIKQESLNEKNYESNCNTNYYNMYYLYSSMRLSKLQTKLFSQYCL